MDKKKMLAATLAVLFGTATFLPAQAQELAAELTEAEVFGWWDDETIAAEEANEILSLIDEGDMSQACALAEIYASHPCKTTEDSKATESPHKSAKGNRKKSQYHITAISKVRLDSTGNPSKHSEKILFSFYNFTLSLGNHELLTYKSKQGEAHFGQISTRELHSDIPLDTLWGTAISISFKKIQPSFLLDTSGTASAQIAARPFKKFSARAAYWYSDSGQSHSTNLMLDFPSGHIVTWYQIGQAKPLLYFRFRGNETNAFSWKAAGYLHGSDVPKYVRLSASIAKHKFWTSQSISFFAKDFFYTKTSASARIAAPLSSDSISGRLALDIESGPDFLRLHSKTTCKEASDNCEQIIFQTRLTSAHHAGNSTFSISGNLKSIHSYNDSKWTRPRTEIAASVTEKLSNKRENVFRIAAIAPDSRPGNNIQIRSEVHTVGRHLELSLIAAFRQKAGKSICPTHAQITSKIFF